MKNTKQTKKGEYILQVPVAFLIFNRPETTRRVFAEIARAKPARLLVVADGPRSEAEAEKCYAARAAVEQIDWECEVSKNYSDLNLGCKRRVSSGLTWVFEQCEEAIILEDDCLPHPTFFRYCAELLQKYRDDNRVMMIGGSNFQFGNSRGPYSYFFTSYTQIWGWASWRRAWRHYNLEMSQWPSLRDTSWLKDILGDENAVRHWKEVLDLNHEGKIDSWDIQWMFTCWVKGGLTAVSNKNLVSNIGFDDDATHTKTDIYGVAGLPTVEIDFPLKHQPLVSRDNEADQFTFNRIFAREVDRPNLYRRFARKLLATLPDPMRNSITALRAKWG